MKLVIVKPGCKEFGNEVLNRLSIQAYGLEAGAEVINRSSYGKSFLYTTYNLLYARIIGRMRGSCSLRAWRAPIFLAPTPSRQSMPQNCDALYFFGWLFRNAAGLTKYAQELKKLNAPDAHVMQRIDATIAAYEGRVLIGVHIRQRNFANFLNGEFLVPVSRVRTIVEEYLKEVRLSPEKVALVVVSDTPLPQGAFGSFTVHEALGNTEENLFLLSKCSVVIGTNTTFSNMAAWFGDVAHVVTTKEPINWDYYRAKSKYFENEYADFAY